MSEKGVSKTLWIIVTAVVVLVVALVLITIFGNIIGRFGSVTEATQFCKLSGRNSCNAAGSLPFDWEAPTITITGQSPITCKALLNDCNACPGVTTTGSKACTF